ncbi:hypothetical protein Desdi_2146 [Desulfitobacterium dichloroeliminans LMG P-21439]|uniref:Uncharacterized protein n=1 Tax=Desulfitobacterium dichloroeliminans (strain LMG P-21439 / DCA1) TaxID=871963 RepID=L0F8S0_DESDL|nr:hypothetical protein [Desulfitobacterium dichloroeliminans]AGA69587.1 hypothetical protein Desdi_2146 [Desulfitobacterium dichloroeliminans LMG P-21439]
MSLRLEAEEAMGLRFPERNGEAVIRFDETMEVPHGAETLMRGLYRNPEEIKKGFKTLHQETATLLEIILPRRARIREWLEELPEQPKEAESFLRETSQKIQQQDRKVSHMENELISKLAESGMDDLFPLPLSVFAQISYSEPCAKIFLRPLGRLAEILKLNPEIVRQVVRIHLLYSLLIIGGQDLDGQPFSRGNEDSTLIGIASFFALKHMKKANPEYQLCYTEWVKAWGGKSYLRLLPQESSIEKVRAAMVFWRRNPELSWEDAWNGLRSLDMEISTGPRPLASWPIR